MSTKKSKTTATKKPETKTEAKPANVIKLADGQEVDIAKEKCASFKVNKDGTVERATPSDMTKAHCAIVNVCDKENGKVTSYQFGVELCENGNYLLIVNSSEKMEDDVVEADDANFNGNKAKVTRVGNGNPMHAAFALTQCMKAWLFPFGMADAYRLVRMELKKGLGWQGLFAPAVKVI